MIGTGRLAIWNDCVAGFEKEYEAWYQGEHMHERLAVPGFLLGRRYEALAGTPQFFTYYETASPDVLTSEAYLERVDNPTSATTWIMSDIFTNVSRTVCRAIRQHGTMRGAWAITVKLDRDLVEADLDAIHLEFTDQPAVARIETWVAAEDTARSESREESLRGRDAKIAACLLLETLREDDARHIGADVEARLSGAKAELGIYRMLCTLAPETARS